MKNYQANFQMSICSNEDIPQLVALSSSVGWDYDEREIKTVMSVGTIYCYKVESGTIISSAAITPYEDKLASIGMVIVHEQYRGYGLGKTLTEACVQSVADDVTVMLIATEDGYPLYEKLGFQPVTSVHKFLCERNRLHLTPTPSYEESIVPLYDHDFQDVYELDKGAIGAGREAFLKARIHQATEAVVVRGVEGNILGYGLCVDGPVNRILGPIVAMNDQIAASLIQQLSLGYEGKLRIDVPDRQAEFMKYLEQAGFDKVSQPPVMILHSSELPRRNQTLFGIAAQIFG
ncbi:GNAT family N-acetyltransferase [Bacillus solimangrovi]|uniref:GNAT family N-acetyltransferase n=1 Tax=Bacillus solimangrovi TaxID=1305675 RepID=A0A1E5LI42_9BACI|nr:GNAT family N-acetyltransferase [Bacillus solimangrovi]OEH93753.1 GNAT family N-acetyltransferase [Bacillus solimangrovi]